MECMNKTQFPELDGVGCIYYRVMESAVTPRGSVPSQMQTFDFNFFKVDSSIICNDLDVGVRMKHAFLNKEVEINLAAVEWLF